jgi:hypothetical protein
MIKQTKNDHSIRFTKDGKLHCANGPTVSWNDGSWSWYLDGYPHRYYGPQKSYVLYRNWYIHGIEIK